MIVKPAAYSRTTVKSSDNVPKHNANHSTIYFSICAPVFTSRSSALLGRPRCGLSIWLSLLAIFNTLSWVYANLFHEKTDKTREKCAIFVWCENRRRRLLGAQSINSEWHTWETLGGGVGYKMRKQMTRAHSEENMEEKRGFAKTWKCWPHNAV